MRKPPPEAVKEALNHPNGWVYEIDGIFDSEEAVTPQYIKGAWQVNESGVIIGDFIPNPNYKSKYIYSIISLRISSALCFLPSSSLSLKKVCTLLKCFL